MRAHENVQRHVMIAVLTLGVATIGFAQSSTDQARGGSMASAMATGQTSPMTTGDQTAQQPTAPPCWQQQRDRYQKMLQQRQEEDQRLQSLVEKMDSSTGAAKVDAMQAVIDELVKERAERGRWWGDMVGWGMGRGMGYGMGPGMGYGMSRSMGHGMGYGMGPGPCCPCPQQKSEQGGDQGPGSR
jgi:hypothetical protein